MNLSLEEEETMNLAFKFQYMYSRWYSPRREYEKVDSIVIGSVLATKAQVANIGSGFDIQGYIVRHILESDVRVSSTLVNIYSKCGFLHLEIFYIGILSEWSIISYNSVISSLGLHGYAFGAFRMFDKMLPKPGEDDSNSRISVIPQGNTNLLSMSDKVTIVIPMGFYFALLSKDLEFGYLRTDSKAKLQAQIPSLLHFAQGKFTTRIGRK